MDTSRAHNIDSAAVQMEGSASEMETEGTCGTTHSVEGVLIAERDSPQTKWLDVTALGPIDCEVTKGKKGSKTCICSLPYCRDIVQFYKKKEDIRGKIFRMKAPKERKSSSNRSMGVDTKVNAVRELYMKDLNVAPAIQLQMKDKDFDVAGHHFTTKALIHIKKKNPKALKRLFAKRRIQCGTDLPGGRQHE